MARLARVIAPGHPHHVTHRGNRRADVFYDDHDRRVYLLALQQRCEEHDVQIWSYCLMTNHVHLVVVPADEAGLSKAIHGAHSAYARFVNSKYDQCGHLWQGRFFSCVLDEPHLWAAVRYVERNPVRANMLRVAERYPWSSAACHCGRRPTDALLRGAFPPPGVVPDWSAWLGEPSDAAELKVLRHATRTGRPCGSRAFIEGLERLLGRVLLPKKRGPREGTKYRRRRTGPAAES